ncbi:MAG: hydantoinase/oxoprolinase N-terminal domain-containing protein, partial [Acidobacteriota bacterium]
MAHWRIWIDTGGTFTDCLALTPDGDLKRVKVLSSSALRATAIAGPEAADSRTLHFEVAHDLPENFAVGARLSWLGGCADDGLEILGSTATHLRLSSRVPPGVVGRTFELRFNEEAPVLAARLVTGAATAAALPPLQLRLATTRGTNALLERRGAKTVLFVTRGFADLLRIGDQRRPDIFARHIERPEPLTAQVFEVAARVDAAGVEVEPLDLDLLEAPLAEAARDFESAAVALLHSHRRPDHEEAVAARLGDLGLPYVSVGSKLSPTEGYLARVRTAVVDAYLQPVIRRYLDRISSSI